jgi:hypothetical protein
MATSKIQDRIRDLARTRWESGRAPVALADLGAQLAKEFQRDELQKEFLGGKLKNYIEYNLGHELRIVQHPGNPIVWGVVPKNVTESAEVIFSRPAPDRGRITDAETGERLPYIRYDYELWKAFTTTITGDRYIGLGERVLVADLPKGSNAPENSFRVEAQDVVDSREGYPIVSRNIESWAERNKVDISRFKTTSGRATKKTLLDFVIESLAEEELKQLSLPMNVIKILNSKRI